MNCVSASAGKSGGVRRDSRYWQIHSISLLALLALSLVENLRGAGLRSEELGGRGVSEQCSEWLEVVLRMLLVSVI